MSGVKSKTLNNTIEFSNALPVRGELLIRGTIPGDPRLCYDEEMRDLVFLFIHLIATLATFREWNKAGQGEPRGRIMPVVVTLAVLADGKSIRFPL